MEPEEQGMKIIEIPVPEDMIKYCVCQGQAVRYLGIYSGTSEILVGADEEV
jgi:hypothetical protein